MPSPGLIYVLIADDSAMFRELLRGLLESDPDMAIIGEARDGRQAVQKAASLKPNVIVMDVRMPVMDGLEAVGQIMEMTPTPILVCSASVRDSDVDVAMTAIKLGAMEVIEKPNSFSQQQLQAFRTQLIDKIKLLSKIKVVRHRAPTKVCSVSGSLRQEWSPTSVRTVGVGASTGGPKALIHLLSTLDASFPACILLVQHISEGFYEGFVKWLATETALRVEKARTGMDLRQGVVLVAPPGRHLTVSGNKVSLASGVPVNGCCPSVDVLFESLAKWQEDNAIGVLLTGMGRDGARGAQAIKDRRGCVLVQNEETCAVFGMPKAAIELNAATAVLPVEEIAHVLLKRLSPCPPP